MVTKGIITSIDFGGNTCEVRMPYFENAGNDTILGTAIFSNTPGSYNGYKVGDVVVVAFEDGQMDNPVVIGKLYLGAEKEKADPRGSLNVENSSVAKSAAIPADTNLLASIDHDVAKTTAPYASLFSVANELNTLKVDVGQQSRLFANIESVVDELGENGEALLTKITQTSEAIALEASVRAASDETLQTNINVQSDRIYAEAGRSVSKFSGDETGDYAGLGWDLSLDAWRLYKRVKQQSGAPDPSNVKFAKATVWDEATEAYAQYVTINNQRTTRPVTQTLDMDSLKVTYRQEGNKYYWYWPADDQDPAYQNQPTGIEADSIKPILTADESGLRVSGTIEAIDGNIGDFTIGRGIYSNKTSLEDTAHEGVYIGPEGIALGKGAFTVTKAGEITISGYATSSELSNVEDEIPTNVSELANDSGYQNASQVTKITKSTIETTDVIAENLRVKEANIQGTITAGKLEVKNSSGTIFKADSDAGIAQIGGFSVDTNIINKGNLGEAESVVMSTGTTATADIGGSGNVNGWNFTAGNNFGIRTDSSGSELYVNKGKIGGFAIDSNKLYTGNTSIGAQDSLFLSATGLETTANIGGSSGSNSWAITADDKFGVTKSGDLYASNAHITGEITASSGAIGGFTISHDGLISTSPAISITPAALKYGDNFTVASDGTTLLNDAMISADTIMLNDELILNGSRLWVDQNVTRYAVSSCVTASDTTIAYDAQQSGGLWQVCIGIPVSLTLSTAFSGSSRLRCTLSYRNTSRGNSQTHTETVELSVIGDGSTTPTVIPYVANVNLEAAAGDRYVISVVGCSHTIIDYTTVDYGSLRLDNGYTVPVMQYSPSTGHRLRIGYATVNGTRVQETGEFYKNINTGLSKVLAAVATYNGADVLYNGGNFGVCWYASRSIHTAWDWDNNNQGHILVVWNRDSTAPEGAKNWQSSEYVTVMWIGYE